MARKAVPRATVAEAPASAERRIGRSDPPAFQFAALRTEALDALLTPTGLAAKLVAIVAPVGYGKTVLMSLLLADLRRTGRQCLWLALDERDAAIESLLGQLEALLAGREARLHPTHALFRGDDPVEARIEALVEAIDRHPLPLILFLDNLHCCTDPALGRLLDRLCFHTRPSVQLVLSSTRELPLDLARARLEGLARVLAAGDLAFSEREVGALLGEALASRIGAAGVAEVARRTEGWPAAVRMAQLILSNSAQPETALRAFSGTDETLAQLLNRQVLSGFSAELREFLFCLAQLRSFCAELCVAAIGDARTREHLAWLVEHNVFLIPLDRNRQWYRQHGLFRDHLLHEAEARLAAKLRQEVLTRAARWCEKQGYWREAVDYALDSGSAATASAILDHIAASFVRDRGDVQQYIRWLEALHAQGEQASPEAEFWFVWALAFHRRYELARQHAVTLAARLQRQRRGRVDNRKIDELQRRIAILRTSIDSLTDHLDDAYSGASAWLKGATADQDDDPFNLTAAHCIRSGYHANRFEFDAARAAIADARATAFRASSAYVDGWVSSYAALPAIHEGNYAAAYAELAPALAATRAALGDDSGICGTMALVAARCAAGMGLTDDARQLLAFGLRSSRTHGFLEAAACGLEAGVLLWTGGPDDVASAATLREIANAYPPRLSRILAMALARRMAVLGRLDEARVEALRAGIDLDAGGGRRSRAATSEVAATEALRSTARVVLLIAAGRDQQAASLIAEEQRRAKASGCVARLVELALAAAHIADRDDDGTLAVRQITRAVSLAAMRRIVQPFDEHAALLARVIARTRPSAWGYASDEERRYFAELCRKLPGAQHEAPAQLAALHETPRLLGQPTPRELELLGYLDAGLSNQQLADRTDVSLTTIKWHLQNLYGKLGVSSRSAAIAKARTLRLLAR